MGQKVPPKANRIPYLEDWTSKWFDLKNAPDLIVEDYQIRNFIKRHYGRGGAISKIIISRTGKLTNVAILTARPGIIIGRRGEEIERVREELEKMLKKEINIQVLEIKEPALDAQLVADALAIQIEKNVSYRRAMKRAIDRVMSAQVEIDTPEGKKILKAQGVKIRVSGRLAGVEIARSEWLSAGRMPLATFRADIDYGFSEAIIKKGKIGIKVWIFKGERFTKTAKDLLMEAKIVEKEKLEAVEEKPLEEIVGAETKEEEL